MYNCSIVMSQIKYLVPKEWESDKKGDFFEKEIGKLIAKNAICYYSEDPFYWNGN